MTCWRKGIVSCDCGMCLVSTDATRKLNGERFDALTIPHFTIRKGGARHGRSEEPRAYYQASQCVKKAHKEGFESTLHPFQTCEIYRSSQMNIGCTEEFCKHLDELAGEDHSYAAARQERERYEKVWKRSLNIQRLAGLMQSRADVPKAFRKFVN